VLDEERLQRMAQLGEPMPPGGLIEFIISEVDAEGTTNSRNPPAVEMRKVWETTTEMVKDLFTSSANFCLELRSRAAFAEPGPTIPGTEDRSTRGTILGRNLDRLRLDCGWSFDELAKVSGVDKKRIVAHVSGGKRAHPRTLSFYADAFTKKLGRTITGADLLQD
jgi:hypothetical protein